MKYFDLHCDTLTVCADKGCRLTNCGLQADVDKLNKSGCAAQCFAIFTQGDCAARDFERYLNFFKSAKKAGEIVQVTNAKQLKECLEGNAQAILTVENLGFTGGNLKEIEKLAAEGVKMASLVWNYENELAYPNVIFENGLPLFEKREKRGLKEAGKRVVEKLDELKIIVDISHLSDGGAEDILKGRKIPAVASHSNAASVFNVCRNLTDGQIKMLSECGGVAAVNYCYDFIGFENVFDGLLKHVLHIIKVGGENCVALGSDFDGIPAYPQLSDCTKVERLLNYFNMNGISADVVEKIAYKNFLRVFEEVCG